MYSTTARASWIFSYTKEWVDLVKTRNPKIYLMLTMVYLVVCVCVLENGNIRLSVCYIWKILTCWKSPFVMSLITLFSISPWMSPQWAQISSVTRVEMSWSIEWFKSFYGAPHTQNQWVTWPYWFILQNSVKDSLWYYHSIWSCNI